ncbi:MAG: hypothetical protein ACYC6R_14730, partial [Anaerolineales bacterium]
IFLLFVQEFHCLDTNALCGYFLFWKTDVQIQRLVLEYVIFLDYTLYIISSTSPKMSKWTIIQIFWIIVHFDINHQTQYSVFGVSFFGRQTCHYCTPHHPPPNLAVLADNDPFHAP